MDRKKPSHARAMGMNQSAPHFLEYRWIFLHMVLPMVLPRHIPFCNHLKIKVVEARGVEPLSPNRIRRPSTCLTALEI